MHGPYPDAQISFSVLYDLCHTKFPPDSQDKNETTSTAFEISVVSNAVIDTDATPNI